MKFSVKHLLILCTSIVFITSCKQSTQQTTDQTSDQELLNKEEIKKGIEEVAYPLPEPFEVYNMLETIGASYIGKVLNPVQNADNYFTEKSKAINVGIYAADLGYVATYNNQVDFRSYSLVLKKLVDELGVRVDYSTLQNAEGKEVMANKDSLVSFITNVFYDTYSFLYSESTPSLAALMAASSWVEGVYIATHISTDTYNNYEIVKIIYQQRESLDKLIVLLDKFKDDEMVKTLHTALTKLKVVYDGTDGSLNKEQLKAITTAIETMRSSLIS